MPLYKHDAFLSYSHKDNTKTGGSILKLAQEIEKEYNKHHGIHEELGAFRVFTDSKNIPKGAGWDEAIKQALGDSRMFLMIISPEYFKSDYCIKEFAYWCQIERRHGFTPKLIVPIYYMQLDEDVAPNADAELARKEAFRRQHLVFVGNKPVEEIKTNAWNTTAPAHIHGAIPPEKLVDLLDAIRSRRFLMEKAGNSPNLTELAINMRFTGHNNSLSEIRDALFDLHNDGVVVLHGLRGSGKSELARTYTQSYASEYPEGRFFLDCQGLETIEDAIQELARKPNVSEKLKLKISPEERDNPDAIVRRMIDALSAGNRASKLLFLDNVDNPSFFTTRFIENSSVKDSRLHILATTSLGCIFTKAVSIPVKPLSSKEGAALFNTYRKCQNNDDWQYAGQMAHALDGHAWSVDLLGAFLGAHDSSSYARYAANVVKSPLEVLDQARKNNIIDIRHPARSLKDLFEPTLSNLSKAARYTLVAANILPADLVELDWLHDVVEQRYADFLKYEDKENNLAPHPWKDSAKGIVMTLVRQGFISIPGKDIWKPGIIATMHGVVHAYLRVTRRARLPAIAEVFLQVMMRRADDYSRATDAKTEKGSHELNTQFKCAIAWLDTWCDNACKLVFDKLEPALDKMGAGARRHELLETIANHLEFRTPQIHDDTTKQKHLALAYCLLANSSLRRGDHPQALEQANKSLSLWKSLLNTLGAQSLVREKLAATCLPLGDIHRYEGAFAKARRVLLDGLDILLKSPPVVKQSDDCLHMQALVYSKLAIIWEQQGRKKQSAACYKRSAQICETLLQKDPGNAKWRRYWVDVQHYIGWIYYEQGNGSEAHKCFLASLRVCQELHQTDIDNTLWKSDLARCYSDMGCIVSLLEPDNPNSSADSRDFHAKAFTLREENAATNQENIYWQFDLFLSNYRAALLAGDETDKQKYHQESLSILDKLAERMPGDVIIMGRLAETRLFLGDLLLRKDTPRALNHYEENRKLCETLAGIDPSIVSWQQNLATALEKLAGACQNNAKAAFKLYNDALGIRRELVTRKNVDPQFETDLFISYDLITSLTDIAPQEIMRYYKRMLVVFERVPQADQARHRSTLIEKLNNAKSLSSDWDNPGIEEPSEDWLEDLAYVYLRMAKILETDSDCTRDRPNYYRKSMLTLKKLHKRQPGNEDYRNQYFSSLQRLAHYYVKRGATDFGLDARTHLHDAFQIGETLNPANQDDFIEDRSIMNDTKAVCDWLRRYGDLDGAKNLHNEAARFAHHMGWEVAGSE